MPSRSRRSFRRRRHFRGGKREYIWVATFVTADEQVTTGAVDEFPIVQRDDWARNPSAVEVLEKGAVLVRIVGDIRIRTDNGSGTVSPAGASYALGIRKVDEDDSTILDLQTNFFQEDWLWTRGGSIPPNNATSSAYAPQPNWRHEVDIGVKRKLTSEDEIRFSFGGFEADGNDVGTTLLSVDYYFRCLVQLP